MGFRANKAHGAAVGIPVIPEMTQADLIPQRARASVVCQRDGQVLTVRAVDPVGGHQYLFLPGGGIEPGESPAEAAVRETLEETGYSVRVINPPLVLEYAFPWGGKMHDCRTYFFRAELVDRSAMPAEVNDDDFLHGEEWVALEDIDAVFAYHPVIHEAVSRICGGGARGAG